MLALATIPLALGAQAAGDAPARAGEGRAIVVRPIESPAGSGSVCPRLARGADGALRLAWVEPRGEGRHALLFATRAGGEWSAPRVVGEGERWLVNWADFPNLCAKGDLVVATWLELLPGREHGYGARIVRSTDGGASFGEPRWLHDDLAGDEHGFVSLADLGAEGVGILWLDARARTDADPTGPTALLYRVLRPDGSLSPEEVVDPRVCDCCGTSLTVRDGVVTACYRGRDADEGRDVLAMARSGSGWRRAPPPRDAGPAGGGRWVTYSCPVNGPVASEGWVAAYTEAGGTPRVYASGPGEGRAVARPVDVGDCAGRVDVAGIDDREALVSWLGRDGDGWAWRLAWIDERAGEAAEATLAATDLGRSAGFGQLERGSEETLFAWVEPSEPPRVRVLRIELAPASRRE